MARVQRDPTATTGQFERSEKANLYSQNPTRIAPCPLNPRRESLMRLNAKSASHRDETRSSVAVPREPTMRHPIATLLVALLLTSSSAHAEQAPSSALPPEPVPVKSKWD